DYYCVLWHNTAWVF
nr:immunoglobulin light chain junction region [Macaca mulatta]